MTNDHIICFQLFSKIKFAKKYVHFCPESTRCKNPKEKYLWIIHYFVNNDVASISEKVKRTAPFDNFVNYNFAFCPFKIFDHNSKISNQKEQKKWITTDGSNCILNS